MYIALVMMFNLTDFVLRGLVWHIRSSLMYIYIQAVTYLAVWALPFVALVKPWLWTLIKNCSYAFVSWDIFRGNYSLQRCNSNFYGVSWLQVPHFGVVSESVWWNGKKVIVNSPIGVSRSPANLCLLGECTEGAQLLFQVSFPSRLSSSGREWC